MNSHIKNRDSLSKSRVKTEKVESSIWATKSWVEWETSIETKGASLHEKGNLTTARLNLWPNSLKHNKMLWKVILSLTRGVLLIDNTRTI